MKFIAILILMYFMMGFLAGMWLLESRRHRIAPPKPSIQETPPFELPLQLLLLAILLGLPLVGYAKARKQGEFLRFSPKVWMFLPPSMVLGGIGCSFLSMRFL